jgi:large subunit ribosomal protein L23
MTKMHSYEVLRKPLITEKSTYLKDEKNEYIFEVSKQATKPEIKKAVEKAFKVNVIKVNVITVPGKSRRMGNRVVKKSDWKKAVVRLQTGDTITFFEGV